jgi:hypothetical protein
MRYDSRMRLIQDRTPSEIGGALKRASKPSPDPNNKYLAKDYRILEIMGSSTTSGNSYDISELREKVLRGEPFPPPTESHYDWFDGQPVSEMEFNEQGTARWVALLFGTSRTWILRMAVVVVTNGGRSALRT